MLKFIWLPSLLNSKNPYLANVFVYLSIRHNFWFTVNCQLSLVVKRDQKQDKKREKEEKEEKKRLEAEKKEQKEREKKEQDARKKFKVSKQEQNILFC